MRQGFSRWQPGRVWTWKGIGQSRGIPARNGNPNEAMWRRVFLAEGGRLLSPARVQGTPLRRERLTREAGAGRAELRMACSGVSISGKIALLQFRKWIAGEKLEEIERWLGKWLHRSKWKRKSVSRSGERKWNSQALVGQLELGREQKESRTTLLTSGSFAEMSWWLTVD